MNKSILVGNTGTDPQVRTLESGRKVANISLATQDFYKDKDGNRQTVTDWHKLVFWGRQADIVEKYVKKGDKLAVTGKIKSRSYDDADGVKRYVTEVVVENFEMIGRASANENNSDVQNDVEETNASLNEGKDDLPF